MAKFFSVLNTEFSFSQALNMIYSGGPSGWDAGVSKASDIYGGRMHNLCCDNCHSHVATALDIMEYGGSSNWNMVSIAARMLFCGRFVR